LSTSFSLSFIVSESLTSCLTILIEKSRQRERGEKERCLIEVLVESSGNSGNNNNNNIHTLSLWAKCVSSCNLRTSCWLFSNVVCTFSSLRCIYCYMFFFFPLFVCFFNLVVLWSVCFLFFDFLCLCVCACACLFSLL